MATKWYFRNTNAAAGPTAKGSTDTYTIGVGQRESNANMNLYFRYFVYVWRSGSGNVKTIPVPTSDPTEEGTAETGCVHNYTGATGNFSILENDRIVCEVWADIRNTKNVSYTATLYYDGTTDVLESTTTSDAASYMSFTQTLTGISTTTTIQKDLAYRVGSPTTIQKDIAYAVQVSATVQKNLAYAVPS